MTDWHKWAIQNQDEIAKDCAERGGNFVEEMEAIAEVYRLLSDERLSFILDDAFRSASATRAKETEHVAGYVSLMASHGYPKAPFTGLKHSKSVNKSIPLKKEMSFKAQHQKEAQRLADAISLRNPKLSYTAIRNQVIKQMASNGIVVGHSTLKNVLKNPNRRR